MRRAAALVCGARPFQRHVLPGVPSFLILAPLFASCPFGSLPLDTSRASGRCLPSPSPTLSTPGLFRASEPFSWAHFFLGRGWRLRRLRLRPPAMVPPGALFPLGSRFPLGRGTVFLPGRTAFRNIGSAPRAKKKAAVLCGNGGLFPVGWRTTGTSWD